MSLLIIIAGIAAEARDDVLGYWAGDQSVIHVTADGDTLAARVIALSFPTYQADEDFGPVGAPRRDDNNPDADLKRRPVLGIDLLSEYRHTGKRWEGKIYDPESGNTYSSRIWVDDGDLKMRGYIGTPILGRTATFVPLRVCDEHITGMLKATDLTHDRSCNLSD